MALSLLTVILAVLPSTLYLIVATPLRTATLSAFTQRLLMVFAVGSHVHGVNRTIILQALEDKFAFPPLTST